MKIQEDIKVDIQSFVYFLFKGTLDKRLIDLYDKKIYYVNFLIKNQKVLYNTFIIFSSNYEKHYGNSNKLVTDYILSALEGNAEIHNSIDTLPPFWQAFMQFVHCFCFNTFPFPMISNYLADMEGVGTDAVPAFAVWTNVIELENGEVINNDYAIRRANERMKIWEGVEPNVSFKEWELDQEIW